MFSNRKILLQKFNWNKLNYIHIDIYHSEKINCKIFYDKTFEKFLLSITIEINYYDNKKYIHF